MNKNHFFKFFQILKNPLWIIVVLLTVVSFLLWDISQRIGHDYMSWSTKNPYTPATGLYKAIYSIECPDFNSEEIIDVLKDIYYEF